MRAFTAAVAVVIAVLLGVIAFELHSINTRLEAVAAPFAALRTLARSAGNARPGETRDERIARRARELEGVAEENAEVMRLILASGRSGSSAKSQPSQQPTPQAAPPPARPVR